MLPDDDGIPLGAYGDALLRAAWDEAGAADALLQHWLLGDCIFG